MRLCFWSGILASELANLRALCGCLAGELPRDPDWDEIVALANRTLTTPSLADHLPGNGELPDDLTRFLETVRHRTRSRNQAMHAQLTEAVDALADQGITPMLCKGAAFLTIHGDTYDSRLFGDLDFILPASQADKSIEALKAIGYGNCRFIAGGTEGVKLGREIDAGEIEIRYTIRLPYPSREYADLVPACREYPIGRSKVLIPSATLQAAILVIHDQLLDKDYWRGLIDLKHLFDIRTLHQEHGGIDWEELIGLFPKGLSRRALHTQLLTLGEFFGVSIPEAARRNAAARMQLRRRKLQMKCKWLRSPLTLLTLLADPPRYSVSRAISQAVRGSIVMPLRNRMRIMNQALLAPGQHKV